MFEERGIPYTLGQARPQDGASLELEMRKVNPTHVLSTIGRTHGTIGEKVYPTIDYLEQPGKLLENLRDNLQAPLAIATLCTRLGIHLTRLGTGCIFKYDVEHPFGTEEKGFTESDIPNFFGSAYSTVMGVTDQLMRGFAHTTLNLRIRMPIAPESNHREFVSKITKYRKICSVPNSMTVLPDILPIILDMMKTGVTGTYNMTNPGLISHDEILEMYRDIVDPSFTWENFSEEEQAQILASERSNNYLDTSALEDAYPGVLPIRDAVRLCLARRAGGSGDPEVQPDAHEC